MEVIIDVKVDDVGERIVALEGGPPWGFRMHGNCDNDKELQISRVNPGSKASLKGVREGDLITSINGRPTKEITNSEAHTLLKSAGDRLVLGLNEDCQNSPKRRQYKTILHHHRQEVVHETSKTSTSTSHTTLFTTNDPNSSTGKQNTSNNTNGDQVNIDEDTIDGATIPKTNGVVEINEVFEKEAKSSIESTPNVRRTNGLTFANNTNPFRQPVSPGDLDKALESEYENFFEQQEVDETPCVSTATPTPTSAATPTLTPTSSHYSSDTRGIWSPGQKSSFDRTELQRESTQLTSQESLRSDDNVAPIWTPKSAGSSPTPERKEFRPVSFESPVLQRKNRTKSDGSANAEPPWNKDINSSVDEKKLPTSQSAPGPGFGADFSPRLPKAQNPTITLLQKAREGQIPPKSAVYIEQDRARRKNESPYNSQNDLIYNLRTESISDSDSERPKRVVHHQVRQPYEGIGPTTTHGMPVGLRSEIRDANMTHWYKRMYETIHKHRPSKYDDEEYVTIRYKQRNRARQPFATGYLSEPEAGAYDSDVALSDDKYATLDRRRTNPYGGSSSNVAFQTDPTVYNRYATYSTTTLPNSVNKPKTALKPTSSLRKREEDTTTIRYKPQVQQTQSALQLNKPGKIENYTPGKSSISESEAKKWWDEVMDIFDGMEKQQLQQQQQRQKVPLVQPKGYLSQALKESGYESDSTLVFRRRDETAQQLNPHEQREVYKIIQKGGDVPLHGLRKVVPDRPKEPEGPPPPPPSVEHDPETQENNTNVDLNAESPRKYVENEVTIHYRTPVRQEVKEEVDEHVLARQQADAMRKIYEKDRQRKHQQVSSYSDNELLDRRSRRHTDNFTPSQKSPIPLNRYDDFIEEMSSRMKSRPRSPEPRLVARAVYNFVGQSARELTFKKGDVIFVRRQIDKNWYEGELNAMIGLFPSNYVEIVPYEGIKTTTRRANEGQARAKYNFIAQSHLELSLAKGELVVVTRRVDDNWYEGRIGGRKGIFPMSYVEMLVDPQEAPSLPSSKPVASPAAHSMLLNGSSGGKESMGTHNYVPTFPTQDLGMSYRAKPVQITDAGTYGSLKKNPVEQALHIDIQNDPVPYKALYKYRPQNEDELELLEGDVVQVLEKCDDGWFVGTSERTGAFGTFPGNYVEKIN